MSSTIREYAVSLLVVSLVAATWFLSCDGGGSGTKADVSSKDDSGMMHPASCIDIDRVNHKVYPPAGIRVTFRVLGCDGYPIKKLTEQHVAVINDEKGTSFGAGEEGGGASAPDLPSEFGLYSLLVLDMSDSIFNNQAVDDVIDGAKVFVQKMVEETPDELKQRVAIMVFGMPKKTQVVQGFTDDAKLLNAKLEELRVSESLGTTDLYGALTKGLSEVQGEGQGLDIVERSVVILTDGTHEAGDEENMRQDALSAKSQAEANDVTVFSIGIKGEYDEEKIRELASKDDYFVLAENAAALSGVFETVAARVAAIAESNYVVGVCTPVVFGSPSLTIKVAVDDAEASTTVPYSTGFLEGDVANCDADLIAAPCAGSVCGTGAIPGFECGNCDECGTECSDGQCVFTACDGRECGDDGCAGSCGACQDGWQCNGAQQCFDPCEGKECSGDGFGGTCGTCEAGRQCGEDQLCFDPCEGKECGDDGFGESCGECDMEGDCEEGQCIYPWWDDPTTGLTWQNPPKKAGGLGLSDAKEYCSSLELDGGGWRLPNVSELRSLIRGCPATMPGGSCNVQVGGCLAWSCEDYDACWGCEHDAGPANGGCYWPDAMKGSCEGWYWSSSPVQDGGGVAWPVLFIAGTVGTGYVDDAGITLSVRCVK